MKTRILFCFLIYAFHLTHCYVLAQNVGIGTATPIEKLQVEGNIAADTLKINGLRFPPDAGEGKILTSDADGNARWVEQTLPNSQTNLDHADGNEGFGLWGDCSSFPNIAGYHPVSEGNGTAGVGGSVAISGNLAIVGAPGDKIEGVNRGSATVYFYNGSAWVMMQKLVDPEGETGDYFGSTVAISANVVMVGAAYDDVEGVIQQGSVCCFIFDGTSWVFTEKLVDAEGVQYDNFGNDISLSGDFAILGALNDDDTYINQGSASVFQYNGSNWIFIQKLVDPEGALGDNFGSSVCINGDFIMVGIPYDDVTTNGFNYPDQGSVCVFQYNGTTWDFFTKILDQAIDYTGFGNAVSIDGNYVVIGASAYGNNNDGQACIYWFNGTTWVFNARFSQPPTDTEEYFGSDVAIAGPYALIGCVQDVTVYGRNGSASLYFRVGSKWTKLQFILDPFGQLFDYFGGAVAINNAGRFLIGSFGFNSNMGKATFGKIK